MTRSLAVIALAVLLPTLSEAQESYTINATAPQVSDLDRSRNSENRDLCLKYGLTVGGTCTQSSLCVAGQAVGGSSCTAAQARAANVRLWPASLAGREEYLTFGIAAPGFQAAKAKATQSDREAYCTWFKGSNQTTKDAECSKVGSLAGCELCP